MSWSKGKLQTNPLNLQAGFKLSTITALAVKADPGGHRRSQKPNDTHCQRNTSQHTKPHCQMHLGLATARSWRAGPVTTELLKILQIQIDEEEDQQPEPQERALWSWQGAQARVPGSFVTLLPFREGEKLTKAHRGKNNLSMHEMKFAVVLG